MHSQDLQEPCLTACIFSPTNLPIPGVPTATAVEQAPNRLLASLHPQNVPPSHYAAEFTDGPYLYFVNLDAPHSAANRVVKGIRDYFHQVQGQT